MYCRLCRTGGKTVEAARGVLLSPVTLDRPRGAREISEGAGEAKALARRGREDKLRLGVLPSKDDSAMEVLLIVRWRDANVDPLSALVREEGVGGTLPDNGPETDRLEIRLRERPDGRP